MTRLKNIKIGVKIYILIAVTVLSLVTVGYLNWTAMNQIATNSAFL